MNVEKARRESKASNLHCSWPFDLRRTTRKFEFRRMWNEKLGEWSRPRSSMVVVEALKLKCCAEEL
jgi:hypothetical protein